MRQAISFAAAAVFLLGSLVEARGQEASTPASAKSADELRKEIAAWHRTLATTDDAHAAARLEAAGALASLKDERAVPILVDLWKKEQAARVRRHLVEGLMSIGDRKAFKALVDVACQDRSEQARTMAAKWIAKQENREDAIPQFVKYLRGPKYFHNALTSLGYTEIAKKAARPDPDLVAALIDNLVTVTPKRSWREEWRDTGWFRPLSGGWHRRAWPQRIMVIEYEKSPNEQVRDLLYQYTLQDHGFDQQAWRKSVLAPLKKEFHSPTAQHAEP